MAIDFPNSPAENEQYTVGDRTWTWNGTYWEMSTSTSTFTAGDSEPVDADPGDIWFDSTIGKTFVNYNGTWVEIGNAATVVDVIADADADTKVQVEVSADSDKIEFTTAGTKRLEIDAAGHIIPAANETYDLGSASARFRDIYLSGASIDLGGATISSDGTNLTMPPVSNISGDFTVDTDTLHVDSTNDRVGIGTTAPDFSLDVNGQAIVGGGDNQTPDAFGNGHLMINGLNYTGFASLDDTAMWVGHNSPSRKLYLATDETARLTVDASGNVGIGTTNPIGTVDINGNTSTLVFTSPSNTNRYRIDANISDAADYGLSIGYWDGSAYQRTMTFTDNGRVGIGTISPAANLQVVSQNRAFSVIDTGVNNVAEAAFTSLGGDSPAFGRLSGYDLDLFTGTSRAGLLSRIHVNRGGKIGIGTTTPVAGVDIATTAGDTFTTNGWDSGLILNAASALRFRTSSGIDWGIGNSGSNLYFFSSTSPTTGAAANYRMTINGTSGAVSIAGSLSKGSGSFCIPHPLPSMTETHNLVHSFVEAPRADNMYRGQVTLVDGAATVDLDDAAGMTTGTFELLNRDTQCFIVNNQGWIAVRGSVSGSTLTIEAQDASCTDTVDWLVVGERQDQHMYDTEWTDDDGRVIVEPLRPAEPEALEAN